MLFLVKFIDIVFVLVVAANTFLNIDGVSNGFATHNLAPYKYDKETESHAMEFRFQSRQEFTNASGTFWDDWISGDEEGDCEQDSGVYENVAGASYSCNYRSTAVFLSLMGVWAGLFFFLIVGRGFFLFKYSYSDWRYIFYADAFNSSIQQKVLSGVLLLATLATFIVGVTYLEKPPNAGRVWALINFLLINVLGLLFDSNYCRSTSLDIFDDFTEEIPITQLVPSGGTIDTLKAILKQPELFKQVKYALLEKLRGNGSGFDKLTNKPDELQRLMVRLGRDEDEEDGDDSSKKKDIAGDDKKENTTTAVVRVSPVAE